MSETRGDPMLRAILRETPLDAHDAVCAAWEGLLPERREYLSRWPAAFIAGWLRGLVAEWDDSAPLNVLPEGGYARKVAVTDASGRTTSVWCRVSTRAATVGEIIHCEAADGVRPEGRLHFRIGADGFAAGDAEAR